MSSPDEVWADENDLPHAEFCRACEAGDLASLKSALHPGLNINALHGSRGADGSAPLHIAIQKNHLDVVGFLLALGADLEMRSMPHECYTALQWATLIALPETVRLLLDSGADLHAEFYGGEGDRGPVLFLPLGSLFRAGVSAQSSSGTTTRSRSCLARAWTSTPSVLNTARAIW